MDEPVCPDELDDEDIKETAYLRITEDGGKTSLVQYRDVVKGVKNGRTFAILGVENQSEIDYSMPFRVLEIDFVNYARQMHIIRERHEAEWKDKDGKMHRPQNISDGEYLGRFLKTDRIIRCITLVVYWGEKPWDGPMRLSDMFEGGTGMPHTIQLDMNFLDVCQMPEKEICRYTSELRTVFGFKKYARDKDRLRRFIDNNQEYFNNVSETALNALDELTHSPELQEIRQPKYQTQGGGFNVCQGIQEMIKDGKMEGREAGLREGIKEGEMKKARETAYELDKRKMPPETIAEIVKVSVNTVKKWLDERPALVK